MANTSVLTLTDFKTYSGNDWTRAFENMIAAAKNNQNLAPPNATFGMLVPWSETPYSVDGTVLFDLSNIILYLYGNIQQQILTPPVGNGPNASGST